MSRSQSHLIVPLTLLTLAAGSAALYGCGDGGADFAGASAEGRSAVVMTALNGDAVQADDSAVRAADVEHAVTLDDADEAALAAPEAFQARVVQLWNDGDRLRSVALLDAGLARGVIENRRGLATLALVHLKLRDADRARVYLDRIRNDFGGLEPFEEEMLIGADAMRWRHEAALTSTEDAIRRHEARRWEKGERIDSPVWGSQSPLLRLARLYAWKADEQYVLGQVADALDTANHSLDLHPTGQGYSSRAWIYLRDGRLDDARADVDAALRFNPHDASALNLRGIEKYLDGDTAGSDQDFIKAMELTDPGERPYSHSIYLLNLSWNAVERGDLETAEFYLDFALNLDRSDPRALVQQAVIRDLRGDRDGALAAAREAAELDPGNQMYKQATVFRDNGYYEHGLALLELAAGRVADARVTLDRVMRADTPRLTVAARQWLRMVR